MNKQAVIIKKEKIFDEKLIRKAIGIKWWQKVLFWFRKPYYGYDFGSDDKNVVMVFKKLRGKIYLINSYEQT